MKLNSYLCMIEESLAIDEERETLETNASPHGLLRKNDGQRAIDKL